MNSDNNALLHAIKACKWILREAEYGCLPNMDSPKAEEGEYATTMDAVESAEKFLNALKDKS